MTQVDVARAARGKGAPRILMVSHVAPWPPTSGGRQRMQMLWSALDECGNVDLLFIATEPGAGEQLEAMRQRYGLVEVARSEGPAGSAAGLVHRFRRFARPPEPDPAIAAAFDRCLAATKYDLVFVFQLANLWSCGVGKHPRTVVDVDDLMSEVFESRARTLPPWSPLRWAFRWKARRAREWTGAAGRRVKHLFVVKPEDREVLGDERTTVLANVPFFDTQCLPHPAGRGRQVLLVVASLGYPPNVDGIDHFVRNVWPAVSARHPGAVLRIVGQGLPDRVRAAWSAYPGVELPGYAEDLRREYQEALFCVVPVRYGGGTNIKFVEALAYGRTVVATRKGASGYERAFARGAHFHRADTDAEMIEACDGLLADPSTARTMGREAHAIASREFTRARFVRTVSERVEALLGAPAGAP
jgi:glycosyltransferase involved in cell wall biosynthesis